MTRGCARCGSCCDPVCIDFGTWTRVVGNARRSTAADVGNAGWWQDHLFIAANMRPVASASGVIELQCRYFDREHRECRAYDQRPPMCSGYPWYDREPNPVDALQQFTVTDGEPCCSFVADLPPGDRPPGARPLIPITPV